MEGIQQVGQKADRHPSQTGQRLCRSGVGRNGRLARIYALECKLDTGQRRMPDKKRFGLNSPRELLAKLDWEMEQYNQSPAQQEEIASYRAFNCAVTAWSLCDWVWNAASDDLKARFRAASPSSKTDSPEILAALLRAESRELAICHRLANGAKNFVRNQNNDPQVSSLRLQSVSIFVGDDGQET